MTRTILHLLTPHSQDLGGFQARRCLPHAALKMVGPFIFFDHIGPATFPPGKGVDVRPHPHINLATVTYLFDGALMHRDSLGSVQKILPGAVNWMTAGRGIVHSERSPLDTRAQRTTLHAIQTWVALPEEHEETEPTFRHYSAEMLPQWIAEGATIKLIAGQVGEYRSPVHTFSPMVYLEVQLMSGGSYRIPADYSERAIYSVTAGLRVEGEPLDQHRLAVLAPGKSVNISADQEARCVVIGGEGVGPRIKWWNFVSSRPERIEQAKRDWQQQRFESVPEEEEFIPLPEDG
ncbi:pirin family protein [Lyngbya confervoides]|uniref:Pirin family protein n=1 Tax=Lyngbya confervoides BDU141951 TaxID=1574623 RepID=A0ABD4T019_9CYAN|nr:pirin family protein [Lyngbya confervoides]MCM1981793.1 pirin family protein [Lyngbya confervoides BDU141951]